MPDCFSDEQQAEAVEQVTAYTTTLQTELQQVGYYEGPIDGIYGPATVDAVKRLQADSDLTETGFVDRATAHALDALLANLELQTAATNLTHTASVQTVLTLTGYWSGPIDGVWTDELTVALQDFQTALGVEPTGIVDAATLAAFQQALAGQGSTRHRPPNRRRRRPPPPQPHRDDPRRPGPRTGSDRRRRRLRPRPDPHRRRRHDRLPVHTRRPRHPDLPRRLRRSLATADRRRRRPGHRRRRRRRHRCSAPSSTRPASKSPTTAGRSTSSQATPPPATPTVKAKATPGTCSTRPATRSTTPDRTDDRR